MQQDQQFKQRFLEALRHHIDGWRSKIARDFSKSAYLAELADLASDPVYARLGFALPEYVLVRLVGRMSISVGRRLGEIYDKVPRFVAAARFGLSPVQVAEKFDGLELDIALRLNHLSPADHKHVSRFLPSRSGLAGLGIEIRYNFNPNDSARLRKDVDVGRKLIAAGLHPIYLIFSSISPRDDAIARLARGGWHFIQGDDALAFLRDLLEVDIMSVLDDPEISDEVKQDVQALLREIFISDAFQQLQR